MDIGALASAMIAARIGEVQLAVAAKLIRMDAQAAASAAQLIDAAEANVDRLANVAARDRSQSRRHHLTPPRSATERRSISTPA